MAAEHVAQERAQVTAKLAAEHVDILAVRRQAGNDRALERDRMGGALRKRMALLGNGAERGEPAGQAAARRALRLQQRTQRQQVVGQRLARRRALETELE